MDGCWAIGQCSTHEIQLLLPMCAMVGYSYDVAKSRIKDALSQHVLAQSIMSCLHIHDMRALLHTWLLPSYLDCRSTQKDASSGRAPGGRCG
jgi:hypothetical protein